MADPDPMRTSYVIVWEYRVPAERAADFERAYGPEGDWASLFRGQAGYLGTELVQGDEAGVYVTIDRWTSEDDLERFMRTSRAEYARLDADLEALASTERLVIRGRTVD
jgi:heme-degrading monooxygenase HmoA